MKLFYYFSLLLFVMISACSADTEEQVPEQSAEDSESTYFEDPDEKAAILKALQAAEEEIESVSAKSNITQFVTADEEGISEENEAEAAHALILDSMIGWVEYQADINDEDIHLKMHFEEDATYLGVNPDDEDDRHWEKVTGEEHEDIVGAIEEENERFLFVNYDALLEHTDDMLFTLSEHIVATTVDEEGEEYDVNGYELRWRGDSNIYHELTTELDLKDPDNLADVDEFSFSLTIDADTNHPMNIFTKMHGTMEVEGESIQVEETISTSIQSINTYEDGDLRVPGQVEILANTNEEDEA